MIFSNLHCKRVLQYLYFFQNTFRVGSNHWPSIRCGIVELYHFVHIIKLINSTYFEDISIFVSADSGFAQRNIRISDLNPFLFSKTIFKILGWTFFFLSVSPDHINTFVAVSKPGILSWFRDSASIACFFACDLIQGRVLFSISCSAVDSENSTIRSDNSFGVWSKNPIVIQLSFNCILFLDSKSLAYVVQTISYNSFGPWFAIMNYSLLWVNIWIKIVGDFYFRVFSTIKTDIFDFERDNIMINFSNFW